MHKSLLLSWAFSKYCTAAITSIGRFGCAAHFFGDGDTIFSRADQVPKGRSRTKSPGQRTTLFNSILSNMEKSKFALIQDEILDAKYALVNGIEFEGLQGDGLKELLLTLQAQRAQQASGGSSRDEAAPPSKATTPKPKTPTHSKVRVKHSAKKAPLVAKVSLVKSPVVKSPVVEAKVGDKKRKSASSSPKKRLTPLAKEPKKQQRTSSADQLRHLRKSIMPGDILSLLMEIRVKGGWVVTWVRGEVTREVRQVHNIVITDVHLTVRVPAACALALHFLPISWRSTVEISNHTSTYSVRVPVQASPSLSWYAAVSMRALHRRHMRTYHVTLVS